jgi:DNA-binding transcriptional regulator YdaS (Cro superfamily)
MDVQTLIDRAGDADALAGRLGVARTTILGWRQLGAIPGARVSQIAREFKIPADKLLKLVRPRKSSR